MKIHEFASSSAQEYMWLAVELDANRPSYNVPYRITLTGDVAPGALRGAIHDVVARHESLRTTFRYQEGELRQLVRAQLDIDIPLVDLRAHRDAEARADELAHRAATGPFDLERGPLVRARLLRTGERRHHLILVLHHLICDGWSTGVLLDELAVAYPARVADRTPELPALEIQYADFARWQHTEFTGARLEPLLAYWRQQLRDAPSTRLATAHIEPSADAVHEIMLPGAVDEAVTALAAAHKCTPFVVLLTAFALLLAAHADEPEAVVGTPTANRPRQETANLIGLFVNMIVIRADLRGTPTYAELLRRVRAIVLGGFDAQVPFEHVVTDLRPQRTGRTPFYQAVFSHQPRSATARRIGELTADVDELFNGAAKYDLALAVATTPDGLRCRFTRAGTVFDAATVQRLAGRYRYVLDAMTADPARCPDQDAELLSWRIDPTLDRGAPDTTDTPAPDTDTDAAHDLRRTITEIWCAVLDVVHVAPHDNFFDLGGHSRLMVEVRDRLGKAVDRKLSLLDLFEYPTIAALATHLAGAATPPDPGRSDADERAAQQREARLRLRQRRGNG